MKTLFRELLVGVSGVSAFYFVNMMSGALLIDSPFPLWLTIVFSIAGGYAVGRYVWTHTASVQSGLISSMALGAFGVGGVGFAGGFFGPIFLMPHANQGPLLGIFITGPLGFIVGLFAGAVYWVAWGRRVRSGDRVD
jgi:hypothetical protein